MAAKPGQDVGWVERRQCLDDPPGSLLFLTGDFRIAMKLVADGSERADR